LEQQPEHGATNELVVVRALSQGAYFVSGDKYGVLRYAIRFERYLGFLLTV